MSPLFCSKSRRIRMLCADLHPCPMDYTRHLSTLSCKVHNHYITTRSPWKRLRRVPPQPLQKTQALTSRPTLRFRTPEREHHPPAHRIAAHPQHHNPHKAHPAAEADPGNAARGMAGRNLPAPAAAHTRTSAEDPENAGMPSLPWYHKPSPCRDIRRSTLHRRRHHRDSSATALRCSPAIHASSRWFLSCHEMFRTSSVGVAADHHDYGPPGHHRDCFFRSLHPRS